MVSFDEGCQSGHVGFQCLLHRLEGSNQSPLPESCSLVATMGSFWLCCSVNSHWYVCSAGVPGPKHTAVACLTK